MYKIINGNCLDVMKEKMSDNSVDLTVTSPPYDDLRKYNGYSFDFEGIAKELYRVTKDGGVVVWVVGSIRRRAEDGRDGRRPGGGTRHCRYRDTETDERNADQHAGRSDGDSERRQRKTAGGTGGTGRN